MALTLVVNSRDSVELELSDLISEDAPRIFPHLLESRDLLNFSLVGKRVKVAAGKYIGLIPVSPDLCIEVRPKFPISNLAHVLEAATYAPRMLLSSERSYEETPATSESVQDFLALNLLRFISLIQERGWWKEYTQIVEIASSPRGRIDLSGTLQNCWSRGLRARIQNELFEHTLDVAQNRLLRHVLMTVLHARTRSGADPRITSELNRALRSLPSSVGRIRPGDVPECRNLISARDMPRSKSSYRRAIELCLLLLEHHGITHEVGSSDIVLGAAVIDLESVFERYIRRTLQRQCPSDIYVGDGNAEASRSLYDDRASPLAQPDLVVVSNSKPVIIADVKYKGSPNRTDVNQIVTYASVYRCPTVLTIYQSDRDSRSGLSVRGKIGAIEVYDYGIDLSAYDLVEEERRLAHSVFGLVK